MSDEIKIALTGKMRSGKSMVAEILWLEYDLTRRSFGGALKYYADKMFEGSSAYPIEVEEYGEPCPFDGKRDTRIKKPRKLYQDFGQAMRHLDEGIWIRHVEQAIETDKTFLNYKGVVIDDLRQPNEYEWAKANGFTIIRVNADESDRLDRAAKLGDKFSAEDLRHDTEQHVDSFAVDYEINNNGDKEALRRKVVKIMSEIKAKGGRYNARVRRP